MATPSGARSRGKAVEDDDRIQYADDAGDDDAGDAQRDEPLDDDVVDRNSAWVDDDGEDDDDATADDDKDSGASLSRDDYAEYGLSEEEAAKLEKAGLLDEVLRAFDRRFASSARASAQGEQGKQGEERKPEKQSEPGEKVPSLAEFDFELSEEEFDPALVGTLKKFKEVVANELGRAVGFIEDFKQRQQTEQFDSVIASWGDDWKEVFGEGGFDEIDRESEQFKARVRLSEAAAALAAGYAANGLRVPKLSVLLERARGLEFQKKERASVRKSVEREAARVAKAKVARTTARQRKGEMSPRERAIKFAEEFRAARGF